MSLMPCFTQPEMNSLSGILQYLNPQFLEQLSLSQTLLPTLFSMLPSRLCAYIPLLIYLDLEEHEHQCSVL